MKNVIVTGGLGFIGFNALKQWHEMRPDMNFFNVDCETYAAQYKLKSKKKWLDENGIQSFCIDISKENSVKTVLESVIEKNNIDTIINFSAESHVDNSISGPRVFFESNVMGVVNLLEVCRKYSCKFHQVSTDEVIGAISPESGADSTEEAKLNPSSPYSSSKASAELIVQSYVKTFGIHATTSRCTNNIGAWQTPEKLVPKVIENALAGKKIPVYGAGDQRRFWIDVRSHNDALLRIVEHGRSGETYNIAPKPENLIKNIDLIKMILRQLGKDESLIEHVKDRAAHDTCYWLDASKIKKELNWEDTRDFEETLHETVQWYVNAGKLD